MRFRNLEKYQTGRSGSTMQLGIPLPQTPDGRVYRYSPNENAHPRHFVLGNRVEGFALPEAMTLRMTHRPGIPETVCPYSGVVAPDNDFTHPDCIKMSQSRPYAVKQQGYVLAKKSIFNKIVGDSHFELEFASFLDGCKDVVSFVKNDRQMNPSLFIEYQNADGSISNYFPDFLVKRSAKEIWIVETKGREDLDDPRKWDRLKLWVADATAQTEGVDYKAMFVREEEWHKRPLHGFDQAIAAFQE